MFSLVWGTVPGARMEMAPCENDSHLPTVILFSPYNSAHHHFRDKEIEAPDVDDDSKLFTSST